MTTPEDRFHELQAQVKVTGIDFIYVHPDQFTLDLYFLRSPTTLALPLTGDIGKENIHIRSTSAQHTPEIPITSFDWGINGRQKVYRFNPVSQKINAAFQSHKTVHSIAIDDINKKVYMTCPGTGEIIRTNFNGGNPKVILKGVHSLAGIAVDSAAGMIYWTSPGAGEIHRMDFNGNNVKLLVKNQAAPMGIALNPKTGKMHWANSKDGTIHFADLSGKKDTIQIEGLQNPVSIALDLRHSQIYWTDAGSKKIQMVVIGKKKVNDLITDAGRPYGLAVNETNGRLYWTDLENEQLWQSDFKNDNRTPLYIKAAPGTLALNSSTQELYFGILEGREILRVKTKYHGDFLPYTFTLDDSRIDFYFNGIAFSFKANCPSDLDCKPPAHECPPEQIVDFPVDYLARDFWSFRRSLLDFASLRYPDWKDRLEADAGIMLAEVMSAMGDEFAYNQDRIGREAFLETATQRRSLRMLARLIDYTIHDGLGSTTWVDVIVDGPGDIIAGTNVWTLSDKGTRIDFEIGLGLKETVQQIKYNVDPLRNVLIPYILDENSTCLPVGCTEIYILGHHEANLRHFSTLPLDPENGRWALLQSLPDDPSIPARVHPVRLINVVDTTDPLNGEAITHLTWEAEQALPFEVCMNNNLELHANLLPVTAGKMQEKYFVIGLDPGDLGLSYSDQQKIHRAIEREGRIDKSVVYLFTLPGSESNPLVWLGSDPVSAVPEIRLVEMDISASVWKEKTVEWKCRRSFLEGYSSEPLDRHYTLDDGSWRRVVGYQRDGVEIVHKDYVSDNGITLRFGDGEFGMIPSEKTVLKVEYRLGGGKQGNVPAASLTNFDTDYPFIQKLSNPLHVTNGLDAENIYEIKKSVPELFRSITYRAVRPEDYAEAAERLSWVQKAGASFRWTGSWLSAFVTPDPLGSVELSKNHRMDLINQLDRFRQAGREVHISDPVYADIDLKITVCVGPDSYKGEVKERVLEALLGKKGINPKPGYFSADHFTFGTILERSTLESSIQAISGVKAVMDIQYRRRGWFPWSAFIENGYDPGKSTIIRVENDPLHPGRGSVKLIMKGGA